jgi:hypothetical protein
VIEGEVIEGDIVDGSCGDGCCGDGCCGDCCCDDCCCDEGIVSGFRRWPLFGHGKHFAWSGHGKLFGWHDGDWGWGDGPFGGWGMGEDGSAGERFYIRGEYIRWSIPNTETPTLVTGSRARRTTPAPSVLPARLASLAATSTTAASPAPDSPADGGSVPGSGSG